MPTVLKLSSRKEFKVILSVFMKFLFSSSNVSSWQIFHFILENQQNGPSVMNGHEEGEEDQSPKPYDIVTIIGKPENCEAAKKMLLETVPITLEVRF